MKKEKWFTPVNIITAIVIAVLVLSSSVTATLFDRGAYIRLEEKLDLSKTTGISEEELLQNYNALIDYNSVFFSGPLVFPTLPMSDTGRIHFSQVKTIFSALQISLMISAVLAALLCVLLLRKGRGRFLAFGGILSLMIPAVVGSIMAIVGWDRFFILFHQAFFNNNYWIFDAQTDPVILILPDEFFLDCLVRIIMGIVISAILLIVFSAVLQRFWRQRSENSNLRKI